MEKWKAFGQGASMQADSGSTQRATSAAGSTPAERAPISTDAQVAKLLKQPANGSGMDALLRAVVYQQWDGLAKHVSDPSFCKMTDKRGCTPLHLTVSHNGPFHVVKSLLATWPEAAAAKDADGATALHHAIAKRASTQAVAAVLKVNPEAVKLQSKLKLTVPAGESVAGGGLTQAIATSADATHGFTPLHWALLLRSTEVVTLLLEADGECGKASAAVACAAGRLPLHTAAANEATGATIKAIIKAHPAALKHTDKHGATPLHHAAAHCAPIESIAELSTQHPAAVQAKAKNGWTPLHYLVACGDSSTPEAARLLINSWSGAVTASDDQGRTPLHVAAASGAPTAVVSALLQRWTGAAAARQQDAGGHTPLHWAAQNSSETEVIRAVRSAYPSAVTMVTIEDRCTPAHLAAARGTDVTVDLMGELLKGEDEHPVLLLQSRFDFTPLHAAVQSKCSPDVIRLLSTLCPKACRVQAHKSKGRTPLHIAAVEALRDSESSTEQRRACSTVLALITVDPETVHLLQAFDRPAANAKSRARGSGESGASIVARLRNGDAGDEVREAVEKCRQEGTAASEANAAELLAILAQEEAEAEKKKNKKKKKKKVKPAQTLAEPERDIPDAHENDTKPAKRKVNHPAEKSERVVEVPIGQDSSSPIEKQQAMTTIEDDGGEWITSRKGRKGRRRKGTIGTKRGDNIGLLQSPDVVDPVPKSSSDKRTMNGTCNQPASTSIQTEKLTAVAACDNGPSETENGTGKNSHKHDEGKSAGGVMRMEELWDNKHKSTRIHTAAPAASHKLQLQSRAKNIPAGLERQRAGKQLFMEALWATRGRGAQKWPTDLSRSHYQGFSSNPQTLLGADGVAQPDKPDHGQVCPQCGWKIGKRLPKRKLLITDPATGAPVAPPNDLAVQVPTGSANIKEWNVADVCKFVVSLLPDSNYTDVLRDHEVDGGALSALDNISSKGFELLGITKFGHVNKIASVVATLKTEVDTKDSKSSDMLTSQTGECSNSHMRIPKASAGTESRSLSTKGDTGPKENASSVLSGSRIGSPGKAGGVQTAHDNSRLDLPAPPPNEVALRVIARFMEEMMSEPVVASDGHTYERLEIERWLRNTHQVKAGGVRGGAGELSCSSPMTGESMDGRLVPNEAIKRQINEYCERHGLPAPGAVGTSPSSSRDRS